ncbi:MAG: hypothetical protein HOA25_10705 [Gammaproteobacteria bacterium]|nr:hypothetical protein [Gammaproteobacteria bacterium]
MEFRQILEQVEGFRVCQCIGIFYGFIMDDLSDGQFDDLTANGARNVCYLDDFRRNMPRGGVLPDGQFYGLYESII